MKRSDQDTIIDVEVLNPYQLPIIKNLKASIIDVKARDKKGKTYIVEMQVAEPEGLDKRLLYYASKEYAQQIESGDLYTELKPVIFIGIFDFMFTYGEKYRSHHAVCDVENGDRIVRDMDFYFIELPKFSKPPADLTEITDKWIFFIKEAENLTVIPENIDDEGLKAAYHDANKHAWEKEELEAYDYAAMREQDERGKLIQAEKKGANNRNVQIAWEMKLEGEPVEKIIRYTGLTTEEIQQL